MGSGGNFANKYKGGGRFSSCGGTPNRLSTLLCTLKHKVYVFHIIFTVYVDDNLQSLKTNKCTILSSIV
jgi:hypothetical protein